MIQRVGKYIEEFRLELSAKGSFTQNLAITFSGNALAQALGFLFTPFIARIYGPEVYGLFALFISITNNIAPIATLQFPSTYVIAKNEGEFHNLLRITFITLLSFSTLSFVAAHLFKVQILIFFNASELTPFIYLIPVYFFFMGVDHVFVGWNIRHKEFFRGAMGKVFSTSMSKGITLLLGLTFAPTAMGMIMGNLLTFPLESIAKFNRNIRREIGGIFQNISWTALKHTFNNYKAYPFFVTPGMIINNLSNQLPVYYFAVEFNQTIVGYFALANSLVMMPISIVISSSTPVFLQKAAEVHRNNPDQLKELVLNLYKRLSTISIISLVSFALVSEWVFQFLFGKEWIQSGVFASVLCLGTLFFVPAGPLSVLFRLTKNEHISFTLNVIFTAVKFIGLYLGIYYGNIIYSIIGFSLACMIYYGVTLAWIFKIVNLKRERLYRDLGIVIVLFFLILHLKL